MSDIPSSSCIKKENAKDQGSTEWHDNKKAQQGELGLEIFNKARCFKNGQTRK